MSFKYEGRPEEIIFMLSYILGCQKSRCRFSFFPVAFLRFWAHSKAHDLPRILIYNTYILLYEKVSISRSPPLMNLLDTQLCGIKRKTFWEICKIFILELIPYYLSQHQLSTRYKVPVKISQISQVKCWLFALIR